MKQLFTKNLYLYCLCFTLMVGSCQPRSAPTPTPVPNLPLPKGRIVFTATVNRNFEVYIMNNDGSDLKNLTNHPAEDVEPQWSPNGKYIAFVSKRNGNRDIYMIKSDGTELINLTNHPASETQFAWAPNSHQIAFTSDRDGAPQLYLMDIQERNVRKLRETPIAVTALSWSPDGAWLLFLSTALDERFPGIVKMHSGGSDETNLTKDRVSVSAPAWSPDGSEIAFVSDDQGFPQFSITREQNIYVMTADGLGQQKITHGTEDTNIYYSPNWSPDGQWLTYLSEERGLGARGTLITVHNLVTNARTRIPLDARFTWYRENHSMPDWSPDGEWMVFSRQTSIAGFEQNICFYHINRRHLQCLPELYLNEINPLWEPQSSN